MSQILDGDQSARIRNGLLCDHDTEGGIQSLVVIT